MKMIIISFLIALTTTISISCSGIDDPEAFPFDQYDYTLDNLRLGVSFPPSADMEHLKFTETHLESLGISLLRIDQKWGLREPDRDSFHWEPLARRLDYFHRAGLDVLVTLELKDFPRWTEGLGDGEIRKEFREYVRNLLQLFGDKIPYIQMGNEWNWEIDSFIGGNDDLYIALANILYEEVMLLPVFERPEVFSGSLSTGAMMAVAYVQGDLENVSFEYGELYNPEELDYDSMAEGVSRISHILKSISFESLDLHFYDDYWNWPLYLESIKHLMTRSDMDPSNHRYVASEFGGPHPELEAADESFKAERLISYIHALDDMGISKAFYFKLIEDGSSDPAHPNSFIIDSSLKSNIRYEALSRFNGGRE